ncbi:hypothetical protein Tco_0650531, partial [Tanacetum coccineum]
KDKILEDNDDEIKLWNEVLMMKCTIEEKKKNDDEEAEYDESRRRTVRYSANYDSYFE